MTVRRNRISRREFIRAGAVTAAGGWLVLNSPEALAAPVTPATARGLTATGEVIAVHGHLVDGDRLDVVLLGSRDRLTVPIIGFGDVTPRVGDRLTVTDRVPGYGLVALPLCSWITGTPRPSTQEIIEIAGTSIVSSPAIRAISRRGEAVRVCLLDSALSSRQVLGVRMGL
jgi:hypothetical protein